MAVDLGKKVGPLPLGGWLLAVAGGLGISVYLRRRPAAAPAAVDPGAALAGGLGLGGGVGGGAGGGSSSGPDPFGPAGPLKILSNEDWSRAAEGFLLTQGTPFDLANKALSDFLAGNPLSPAENAAIEAATRGIGVIPIQPPPAPDPAPSVTPPSPPPPATSPPVPVPAVLPPAAHVPAPPAVLPPPAPVHHDWGIPTHYATDPTGAGGVYVEGVTPQGNHFSYGGNPQQAADLVDNGQPVQAAPTGGIATPPGWPTFDNPKQTSW